MKGMCVDFIDTPTKRCYNKIDIRYRVKSQRKVKVSPMKKKFLVRSVAILLVVLTVMSTLVILPVSADAITYDISVGSANDLVALGTSIAALTEKTTVYIQLTADINMTGYAYLPVTTSKTVVFEGNNHNISNLSVGSLTSPAENAGLFAQVGVESSASNLTLENVNLHASKNAAGFAATALYGDYEFYNVHVSGTITAHHPDKLGVDTGIAAGLLGWVPSVGEQLGIATCVKASYCTNAANITADSAAGGLVGKLTGPASIQASYCANTGNLTATGVSDEARYFNGDVGGIIALSFHEWSTNAAWVYNYFENCYNTGDLSATTHATASTPSIGGISGVIRCYGVGGMNPQPPYENELVYYNCFDYSKRTAVVPSTVPNTAPAAVLNFTHNAGIAGFCADYEIPEKLFTNCYAVCKPESPNKYEILHSGRNIVLSTSGVVDSAETDVPLSSGTASVLDMIERIDTAIAGLTEIEMPVTVVEDGKERDYTWYYNNGAPVDKGTEAAPYEIATAAQFAALSALNNGHHDAAQVGGSDDAVSFDGKYFKLTADLDLTGYEILPLAMKNSTVSFDGNHHKISNWKISKASNGGMFASIGRGSTVKNLTLDNVDVSAYGESGALIGIAKAGLTVTNVKVSSTSSVKSAGRIAAGFIGAIIDDEALAGDDNGLGDVVKITFCINRADVTAQEVVGGIVGQIKGVFDYQISHCVNKGDLEGNREAGASFYLGGILAYTERGTQNVGYYNTFIKSCYNTGKLTTADTEAACYVGGIVGYLRAQSGSEITIKNCYDTSVRKLSTTSGNNLKNGGIGGNADDSQLAKYIDYSYAVNGEGSQSLVTTIVSWPANNSIVDDNSKIVTSIEAEITDMNGAASTMKAQMAKIDNAIASASELIFNESTNPPTNNNTTSNNSTESTDSENNTATPEDTTAAPAEEKKGCGSTLNSTYAVIALVAVLGFAFVAKKKEEN